VNLFLSDCLEGDITSSTLMEKTGFDKKKLANIIFKLKKQGKIQSKKRGVYSAV